MSAIIKDHDLLAYEPNLFNDIPIASQLKLKVEDGSLAGQVLSSASGGFNSLEVGNVVLIGTGVESRIARAIESIESDQSLTLTGGTGGLLQSTGLVVLVRTFEPQIKLTHEQLMRSIGVDVDDPSNGLDESSVISVGVVNRLECLGTLRQLYFMASALVGDNKTVSSKAEVYDRRYQLALSSSAILIDTDGDGLADVWRRPGVGQLVRQ